MAKIKHNNFLDTVDDVMVNAKLQGVLHLYATGGSLNGRKLEINNESLFHFGTTGYLGLEQDSRLKEASIEAIRHYGTQFPLSKSYISHPLYATLEDNMSKIYDCPVIITKNSTLAHMAVLPAAVKDNDGVILDHQVHWSVHQATHTLKTRSIPVEMVRHNNLEMLEDKIKLLSKTCNEIWFLADGIYSMYGDYAPVNELLEMCRIYPQLRLYFDDVHGMSWKGRNGSGCVMSIVKELPEQVLLVGTLSKTFGASGATVITKDDKLFARIKNFGGPLTFSAQLEPASVGAAIASSEIHLSPEIYKKQAELAEKIKFFNNELKHTDLPLIDYNDSPVHFIGTGTPLTGYELVKLMMKSGFYTNLGIFPAVPVKNTGVRITISTHNTLGDIKLLTEALKENYPEALKRSGTNLHRVRSAFKLIDLKGTTDTTDDSKLKVIIEKSIERIPKNVWNVCHKEKSIYDWDGIRMLEKVFTNNLDKENNWKFRYLIIEDKLGKVILATFFTIALWKDDMLSPYTISKRIENERKKNPYYLTSWVVSIGSLITEGSHLYFDAGHQNSSFALTRFFKYIEELEDEFSSDMVVLRDFSTDNHLNDIFHNQGYVKIAMPDSAYIKNLNFTGEEEYVSHLSKKSRYHYRKEILAFQEYFEVKCKSHLSNHELMYCYKLYKAVQKQNIELNTYCYPYNLFEAMNNNPNYEFLLLYLKNKDNKSPNKVLAGVMFCYKNHGVTYVPSLIGMDYAMNVKYRVYRQLLFQTVMRAINLRFKKIDFGLTAGFEKKKVGAIVVNQCCYIQAKDNFKLELLGLYQGID